MKIILLPGVPSIIRSNHEFLISSSDVFFDDGIKVFEYEASSTIKHVFSYNDRTVYFDTDVSKVRDVNCFDDIDMFDVKSNELINAKSEIKYAVKSIGHSNIKESLDVVFFQRSYGDSKGPAFIYADLGNNVTNFLNMNFCFHNKLLDGQLFFDYRNFFFSIFR